MTRQIRYAAVGREYRSENTGCRCIRAEMVTGDRISLDHIATTSAAGQQQRGESPVRQG